jgi:two-component system response regulator TctD
VISRLLVVEDDPSVRQALERRLRSDGVRAVFAATLSEGIEKLDGCDVALVDLDLPDGMGTDLLRAIRVGARPIRAAIYSAKLDAEMIVARSGERPDAIFRKPWDLDDLVAWVA